MDARAILRQGDERAKRGDHEGAADAYTLVADFYRNDGFMLKAVALYKQIMLLAPERLDIPMTLANTYASLGLTSDAVKTLEALANHVEGDALATVKARIAALK